MGTHDKTSVIGAENAHELGDKRSLAYHRAIALRLQDDPGIVEVASARVRYWRETGQVHPTYCDAWLELLSRTAADLGNKLVANDEAMRALRHVSPFAGVLSPRERWRLWRNAQNMVAM